ncbi:MAG: hypothetical protein ACJ783_16095 [Myxococcales bacterium]
MRRLASYSSGVAPFAPPSACPDSNVVQDGWDSLLGKTPRLRPWLTEMLQRRRAALGEKLGYDPEEIDRILWNELERWLHDFEALPGYAVSAIALDLEGEPPPKAADRHHQESDAPAEERAETRSPETAACELEALVADPAFALAFHCIEARVRPRLASATRDRPSLARVPEWAFFGLLHASIPSEPKLTARVAISLVLRMSSPGWASRPAAERRAALRLFHAGPLDVRSGADAIRASLPSAWDLSAAGVKDFVAAATQVRKGLSEASGLCARLVSRISAICRRTGRARPGGLGLLQEDGAGPASDAEIREMAETARKFAHMTGFAPLLDILAEAP